MLVVECSNEGDHACVRAAGCCLKASPSFVCMGMLKPSLQSMPIYVYPAHKQCRVYAC